MAEATTTTAPRVEELPAPGSQPGSSQPADYVDRLVQRYGNERTALQILGDDNYNLRERHRTDTETLNKLTTEVTGFRELGLKPSELKGFTELGKNIEELKKMIEDQPKLAKKLADTEELVVMEEAAKILGSTKPKLLKKLAHDEELGFTLEMATEQSTVDGEFEVKRVAYATGKASGSTKMKLEDYVSQHLRDYIPSLMADAESETRGNEQIVPFPRQPTNTPKSKAPPAGQAARGYLDSQYKTPGQLAETK